VVKAWCFPDPILSSQSLPFIELSLILLSYIYIHLWIVLVDKYIYIYIYINTFKIHF